MSGSWGTQRFHTVPNNISKKEVKKSDKKIKEVKKPKDLYFSIYTYIKNNKSPSELCQDKNIKKQNLQYYLNKLKQKGLISKLGYKEWILTEKGKDFNNWTHTPSFPMEEDPAKAFLLNVKKSIEDAKKGKFPKEPPPNRWTVENGKEIKAVQPHNVRLYYTFNKDTYNPTQPYSSKNYKSEHHFTFPTHRIVIKKKTMEVTYLAHKSQWRFIKADSEEEIDRRLKEIDEELDEKCFNYAKEFIARNGGESDLIPIRKRKQDWGIHGDDFFDKIPENMRIDDTVFKKKYRDKVELFGATQVKNYISNRALEKFSPEIAKEISINRETMQELNKSIQLEIENKKLHQAVLEDMRDTLKEISLNFQKISPLDAIKSKIKSFSDIFKLEDKINKLSKENKEELEEWILNTFTVNSR